MTRVASRGGVRLRGGSRVAGVVGLALAASVFGFPAGAVGARPSDCDLSDPERAWIQTVLDGWDVVTHRYLQVDDAPVPWFVLFDASCVWHIAPDSGRLSSLADTRPDPVRLAFRGESIPLYSTPHAGSFRLPTGDERPAEPAAVASLYEIDDGVAPYFILALPEVWRGIPGAAEMEDLEAFFAGVAVHELVHTLQLAALRRHVDELETRHPVPERLDDDVVQRAFEDVAAYREAFEREREVLRRAAATTDPGERAQLVRRALRMVRERRDRWFTGERAAFSRLEDLFLNMEGVAVWAHAQLHALWPDRVAFTDSDGYWTQEEGYVLMRLLDALVTDWQSRILSPAMLSPFDLLREAVPPADRPS